MQLTIDGEFTKMEPKPDPYEDLKKRIKKIKKKKKGKKDLDGSDHPVHEEYTRMEPVKK